MSCAQCGHPRDQHELYYADDDPEPWSFCTKCGADCEFVAEAVR